MKNLIVFKNGKMTISSLELVKQINFFREQEEDKAALRHDTLLTIIRDEFSEEIGHQEILESSYINKQNKKQPMYELTTLQAKQLLARESKKVRKALLLYIEKLENLIREEKSNGTQLPTNDRTAVMHKNATTRQAKLLFKCPTLIPYQRNTKTY